MPLLRETLRPNLKPGVQDLYRPTLEDLDENLSGYRGRIAGLMVYPIKSLGGLSVDRAILGSTGLRSAGGFRDRSAMLVQFDERAGQWKRFTQRDESALAQVALRLLSNDIFSLESPAGISQHCGVEDLLLRNAPSIRAATYEDQSVEGRLEPADGQLTRFIHEHLTAQSNYTRTQLEGIRVLLGHSGVERHVPKTHSAGMEAGTEFADVGKYLLVNAATVGYVNEGMTPPVFPDAYRYNILTDQWPRNIEDIIDYATIETGQANIGLHFGVMSTRCAVTAVDQRTGIKRKDREPIASLMRLRPLRDKQPTMGINVADGPEGLYQTIRVGDQIIPNAEKIA